MRISAKSDYAVRAAVELAAAGDSPLKGEAIAISQGIPLKFLENILIELRHAEIVKSQRGPEGGYWLARSPDEITIADVIRATDGPLASVHGTRPGSQLEYEGVARPLRDVWVALRASLREVLESVTLADIIACELPDEVTKLTADPEAWLAH